MYIWKQEGPECSPDLSDIFWFQMRTHPAHVSEVLHCPQRLQYYTTFSSYKLLQNQVDDPIKGKSFSPSVFDVFVDTASNGHGNDGIIPGRNEHESETQAHSQEGQRPAGGNTLSIRMSGFHHIHGKKRFRSWQLGGLELKTNDEIHC